MAYCRICLKSFRIDNCGLSQVKSHERCHKPGQTLSNQRTFEIGQKGQISLSKSLFVLTLEDQVAKADILQALHVVNKNLLFAALKEDSERFRPMFPDSMIAKSYSVADTKSQYVIKFGIADYLTKKLIYDANHVPFLFLFDEVKKQYGEYVSYWSPRYDQVVSVYAGSLFVGHCNADDLVEHYNHFVDKLELKSDYLLHLGMDDPNANLSFENKLESNLRKYQYIFFKDKNLFIAPYPYCFSKRYQDSLFE